LWRWSVEHPDAFWRAMWTFAGIVGEPGEVTLENADRMPGARFFPQARLNFAQNLLRRSDATPALIFRGEDKVRRTVGWAELNEEVARLVRALRTLGVKSGDRVAGYLPNMPEAIIAMLAAASIGAVWSSCSPDFGVQGVIDRFGQIEPKVLFAVDGYHYNGKAFDIRPTVDQLRDRMPGLHATVLVPYLDPDARLDDTVAWETLVETHEGAELHYEPVPFDHPLWVLYSSGTTGLPKGIVQCHGGITLEHLKALALNCDLGPGDRFFWFTTTGWMMWNFLISGLLVGSTIVLYDGSPGHPDLGTLWRLAEEQRITYFGTSAPYVQACLKENLAPGRDLDLTRLRTIGSTGAPLTPEGFRWIAEAVGPSIQIASVSGGTDLCTAFVGAAPDVPVWLGELSCRMLGAAVAAYDEEGRPVVDEVGELVITRPMPSMPVSFWNDPDGSRLRAAYFEHFPGVWRHGDWIRITSRGSAVIYGRSDSTLNRGGVRMGTSEFYRVVEALPEVTDSLVIDTSDARQAEGELLCFLVLAKGATLAEVEPVLRRELRTRLSPRHVPDRFHAVDVIPRTLNGKKCEVPVKKILAGAPPEKAVSRDALRDPESLEPFIKLQSEAGPG
jgi:acetoacetyl-CoA synthetase